MRRKQERDHFTSKKEGEERGRREKKRKRRERKGKGERKKEKGGRGEPKELSSSSKSIELIKERLKSRKVKIIESSIDNLESVTILLKGTLGVETE